MDNRVLVREESDLTALECKLGIRIFFFLLLTSWVSVFYQEGECHGLKKAHESRVSITVP